jgi:hypothetical protein
VLDPPLHESPAFHDFQAQAGVGQAVADHPWVAHEHEAVNGLTARDGTVATHTLLETVVGGVLGVNVVIADVDRQWVRHEDGQLYAAISFSADDVRPRAAGVALQQEEAIAALNAVGATLSTLDGRAWLSWSNRTVPDAPDDEQTTRTTRLMGRIASLLFDENNAVRPASGAGDTAEVDLTADLLRAIATGAAHAEGVSLPHVKELRWLRHRDPLRVEWLQVQMDAFFLGALPVSQIDAAVSSGKPGDLAFLYIGRDRTARLKADPYITPRFHRELAVRSYLTAYALQRLAPDISQRLVATMRRSAE